MSGYRVVLACVDAAGQDAGSETECHPEETLMEAIRQALVRPGVKSFTVEKLEET